MRFFVLFWVLSFSAVSVAAEPPALRIAGEQTPALNGAAPDMAKYLQEGITHITFHHEGFAGADADLFRRASAARAGQSVSQRVQNIHRYHARDAGLGMFAYHYAVGPGGEIAKGRPVRFKPATRSTVKGGTRRADFDGHFAVVALGDFNHERLTPAARASYVRVMSEAQRAYRVPTAHVQPHLAHASTQCPGRYILDDAEALQRAVFVHSLQAELVARGCLASAPDGLWGRKTERALNKLLRRGRSDVASGGVGDRVLFALLDDPAWVCR